MNAICYISGKFMEVPMGMREKLEERIRKKEAEIQDCEGRIREARAYIQALQDATKLLPRENIGPASATTGLRPGSSAYKAWVVLQQSGAPLHITEILELIDMANTKTNRISLGGTLSRYARSNQIFVKTAPNTFGLIALPGDEPPENFGTESGGGDPSGEATW
jgi:hypothetical protein